MKDKEEVKYRYFPPDNVNGNPVFDGFDPEVDSVDDLVECKKCGTMYLKDDLKQGLCEHCE